MPHKGNKRAITAVLENSYKGRVVFNIFPQGWIPDIVILEGLFIIHTTPLPSHSNMLQYTTFPWKLVVDGQSVSTQVRYYISSHYSSAHLQNQTYLLPINLLAR